MSPSTRRFIGYLLWLHTFLLACVVFCGIYSSLGCAIPDASNVHFAECLESCNLSQQGCGKVAAEEMEKCPIESTCADEIQAIITCLEEWSACAQVCAEEVEAALK